MKRSRNSVVKMSLGCINVNKIFLIAVCLAFSSNAFCAKEVVKKSSHEKTATGFENRDSTDLKEENRQSDDASLDVSAASLFIPLLQQIENNEIDTKDNAIGAMFRKCKFYTSSQAVPTAFQAQLNMYHGGDRYALENFLSSAGRGAVASFEPTMKPKKLLLAGDMLTTDFPIYHNNRLVRSAPAWDMVQCYFSYGVTLSKAIKIMATGAKIKDSGLGDKTAIVKNPALDVAAATALIKAMRSSDTATEIDRYTTNAIQGGCWLPTHIAIMDGSNDWSCGGMKVEPMSSSASMGSMQILGDNVFMGLRLNFSIASSRSTSASKGSSSSKFKNGESSTESGKESAFRQNKH